MSGAGVRGDVAITGVGFSELGRDTGLTEGELTLQACRAAIADAGLAVDDIDALTMFPFRTKVPDPFSGPPLSYVQRSLAIPKLRWWQATTIENGQLGALLLSINALLAGQCSHVLCYRAHLRTARAGSGSGGASGPPTVYDEEAHTVPYGAGSGVARGALWAARYMIQYGTTQEQLGAVCVNGREYAAQNPRAYWQTPITIDEYLASRWVCTPLKVLDCDYPIDGATALVISRADAARATRRPVYVESAASGPGPHTTWVGWPEKSEAASRYAAEEMWSRTRLRPADVDVAQLYDGFSFFTLNWLEDLGFVAPGQAGPYFAAGGGRPDSDLPVNTDGGQLGMGRLHGFGKVAEGVLQLRGESPNQIADASVAVVAAGGGPGCASLILTREPVG